MHEDARGVMVLVARFWLLSDQIQGNVKITPRLKVRRIISKFGGNMNGAVKFSYFQCWMLDWLK
jgi:hypothetical protein